MPLGLLICAVATGPSRYPAVPVPPTVVTTPADVTLRMRLLLVSATYTLPAASTLTPDGLLNLALDPVASVNPAVPEPASNVTTAPDVTLRIRWLFVSATYKLPDES